MTGTPNPSANLCEVKGYFLHIVRDDRTFKSFFWGTLQNLLLFSVDSA